MANMWRSSINEDSLETERQFAYPADGVSCRVAEHSAPSNSGRGVARQPAWDQPNAARRCPTISGPSLLGYHPISIFCYR